MPNRIAPSSLILFVLAILICLTSRSRAAESWFELKDFGPVTQRIAVTVSNPADVPVEAALVHLPMAELRKKLPDARVGQICLVDPGHKPARRDAANEAFIPHQVNQRTLIFAVPLEPKEKKTLHIYSAPEKLNMPGFPPKTAWDNRKAYRSFENNLIAYRMETGPGANTMGFGADAFGKTAEGKGLRLVEAYERGHDSYHKLAYWGVDILKVGYGPAIGGVYVMSGNQTGRPHFATSIVECVYSGPVETLIRCTAPVEVTGKKVTVTRLFTLVADDRTIRDELRIEGDDLEGIEIGVGIRDLPNGKWIEKPDAGYAISSGDSNQPESGYTSVAISAVFPRSSYAGIMTLDDPKKAEPGMGDGGHVYILKPEKDGNALVTKNRLTMIWNGDGDIATTEALDEACQRWVAQRDRPIEIEMAPASEARE